MRFRVEVEFALEMLSAINSAAADVAKQGRKATGLIAYGLVKSLVTQRVSEELTKGISAAVGTGHAYFRKIKGTERIAYIAAVSDSQEDGLQEHVRGVFRGALSP